MREAGKFVGLALLLALLTHCTAIHAVPRVLMNVAMERIGEGQRNVWRFGDRVTPESRAIVRPSPDFAYSACAYDLSDGPVRLHVEPWGAYWSLSLYAANSDNYFVLNDREARRGGDIVLVRAGARAPETDLRVVESPSARGVALIRRLAPRADDFTAAAAVARGDVCAPWRP